MIELKQETLSVITGGVHPHLFISTLGTIGVLTSLYLLQKNDISFMKVMCYVGCATSGGVSCLCTFSPGSSEL